MNKSKLLIAVQNCNKNIILENQKYISVLDNFDTNGELLANKDTRKSAVLVLIYPKDTIFHFALIQRTMYKGVHGGQISLPGGKFEVTDENLKNTALREAYEEIGISLSDKNIIASFNTIFVPTSNFLIYPFLAFSNIELTFTIDKREVQSMIEIPLLELKNAIVHNISQIEGKDIKYYLLNKYKVWGATAVILAELQSILKGYTH